MRRSTRKRPASTLDVSDNQESLDMPSSPGLARRIAHLAHAPKKLRPTRTNSSPDYSIASKPSSKDLGTSHPNSPPPAGALDSVAGSRNGATSPSRPVPSRKMKSALSVPHPAPARWHEVYDAITEMREKVPAPVDGMGCANAGDVEINPKSKRLSILISLMLSSQTKDEVVHRAIENLRLAIGGEITLEHMLAASQQKISDAIKSVGFWRKKTDYIMEAMPRLRDEFHSDVPKTAEELTSLKGVGPKMAFLCLQSAWNLNLGIGVDVHMERITNLLGWNVPHAKDPEQVRRNLESWLPRELWADINPLLVGFGQTICLPGKNAAKCGECLLAVGATKAERLCPSARVGATGYKPRAAMVGSKGFISRKTEVVEDAIVLVKEVGTSGAPRQVATKTELKASIDIEYEEHTVGGQSRALAVPSTSSAPFLKNEDL